MKNIWKSNKINLIIIIVLFVVVTLVSVIKNDGDNVAGTFKLTEQAITVYGPDDYYFVISFKDIDEIKLEEGFDMGEALTGSTQSSYAYGIWKNSDYDSYNLCSLRKTDTVIIVTTNDGQVYAFNFESRVTTRNLYPELVEYVEQHR